jgi:plastocyanin
MVAMALAIGGFVGASSPADPPSPSQPLTDRGDRFVPKPPGTKEDLHFWYGPYTVPPGHDLNRIDLDLPVASGYIVTVAPRLVRASDFTEPSNQEAHIHHAHWFGMLGGDGGLGDEADADTFGLAAWTFGTGEELTHADVQGRSAADPHGPIYGRYVQGTNPQLVIYMLHNVTSQPLALYVILDVTFIHGTQAQLDALGGRPYHPLLGVLYGRTFNVPRKGDGRGVFTNAQDDPRGPIQWTSPVDGTIIGLGGHLHPGGINVITENYGSAAHPCPATPGGFGGTLLLRSDSIAAHPFSDEYRMTVTRPAWRAPIHKGDRIRLSGTYENKQHAWYGAMTYDGIYIDNHQPPVGHCAPYLVGPTGASSPSQSTPTTASPRGPGGPGHRARSHRGRRAGHRHYSRRARDRRRHRGTKRRPALPQPNHPAVLSQPSDYLTTGDPTRPPDQPGLWCGAQWGGPPCDRPEQPTGAGMATNTVTIANFIYYPGDRGLTGPQGAPVQIKQGTSLTFFNADNALAIRHTVTTCPWPCNGPTVSNYPLADGFWDSGILSLGIDMIDGSKTKLSASTPPDLPVGKYSYFCRLHPWMRGAFEVVK